MNDAIFPKKAWTNYQPEQSGTMAFSDKHYTPRGDKMELPPAPSRKTDKFLVIDSIKEGKNLVCFVLKKLGYSFELVDSTDVAISRLRSTQYRLIFLNLDLFCRADFRMLSSIALLEKDLGRQTPIIGMQCESVQQNQQSWIEKNIVLRAIINKSSIADVANVVESLVKPKLDFEMTDLVMDKNDMTMAQLHTGLREFEASLSLLPGALKTVLSCLKLAMVDRDAANIVFLAKSLQESCRQVGLISIDRIADRLIVEAESKSWSRVSNLIQILNAQCNAAIIHLQVQSESDFSRILDI